MVQAVAAVSVPVRIMRPRRETMEQRWQRALEEALDVLIEPVSGEAFVESASQPGTLYAVSRISCTCPAGQRGDAVCKHRACYLAQIGELALPADLPTESATVACIFCDGTGRFPNDYRQCYDTCSICEGTGVRTRNPEPEQVAAAA